LNRSCLLIVFSTSDPIGRIIKSCKFTFLHVHDLSNFRVVNEYETRSILQDDASFHDTNDDSMSPVADNINDTVENGVVEEEDQTTDTARLLRSFFRRMGRNPSR
jgi:hypothetical protein